MPYQLLQYGIHCYEVGVTAPATPSQLDSRQGMARCPGTPSVRRPGVLYPGVYSRA